MFHNLHSISTLILSSSSLSTINFLSDFPKKMATWLPSEELQLCVSWARQSTCPITGRYQTKDNFWKRVHDDYIQNWRSAPEEPIVEARTKIGLESHFPRLKKLLLKWHSSINHASNRAASGTNLLDEVCINFFSSFKSLVQHTLNLLVDIICITILLFFLV